MVMRAVDIIIKKRDKLPLTKSEIDFFIHGFVNGEIKDYQAAAFSMAVLLNGMTPQETTDLTMAMVNSGNQLDLSSTVKSAVDKHSTGGVGDKVSLVVMPVVSACGLPVGKMSGRGLGFSGGTLDKIESIRGFRVDLTTEQFLKQLKGIGLVLAGQTHDLVPADGLLYALRDVTGTIPSIPLIASSIMSKKIASGAQAIVLDVKIGNGAFMKNLEDGRELAVLMVQIAKLAGRKAVALLSDMNQPLGNAVGNVLEIIEALETLKGHGPADLVEHCTDVAAYMLLLGSLVNDLDQGRKIVRTTLGNGRGFQKFRELVIAQGGDVSMVDDPHKLPKARFIKTCIAGTNGYIQQIQAQKIGESAVYLGAGRAAKGDPIDHAVGIEIHHKVGDQVKAGDPLFTIHANDQEKLNTAVIQCLGAHKIYENRVDRYPIFYGVVD